MRKLWKNIVDKWWDYQKTEIMLIQYNVVTNKIECKDWISQKIAPFSGQLTPELWKELKPYCKLGNRPHTALYIWAGFGKKHLAHGEPVDNYLDDYKLLQTGQGFDTNSGVRYGQKSTLKCPTCKRIYD